MKPQFVTVKKTVEDQEVEGLVLAETAASWEKRGWTVVDTGSSESDTKSVADSSSAPQLNDDNQNAEGGDQ